MMKKWVENVLQGYLKGNVQRKLKWVENGVIRRVQASHRGAGYYLVDLGVFHLVYALFPFPVSTSQASSGRIGEAVRVTQRQQYWRYIAETANIAGAWHMALIGEAGKRWQHLQAKRGKFVAPI